MAAPVRLNERATVQKPPAARDGYGRKALASGDWPAVAENIWVEVQDVLPSRAEQSENGVRKASKQARLRLRKQIPIAADMRVVLHGRGDRIMQVIAGPALLDDKTHVECMLEEIGNG
ncbi:MAG: phage head completion protein [Janthinobacterium lividum]